MHERQIREPSSDHPISVRPTEARVVVKRGGIIIADTLDSLTLYEASYPPVHYIPLADVDEGAIRPSAGDSYCPFKGEAHYYALTAGGPEVEDAVWAYEQPYEAVAPIKGHVAFYDRHVEIEVGEPGQGA